MFSTISLNHSLAQPLEYLWEILEGTQVHNTLPGRNQRKSCSEFIVNAQKKEVLCAFSAVDAKDGLNDVKHW